MGRWIKCIRNLFRVLANEGAHEEIKAVRREIGGSETPSKAAPPGARTSNEAWPHHRPDQRPEGGTVVNDSTLFSFNCTRSELPEGHSWNVWTEDGLYSEEDLKGIWMNTLFSLAGIRYRDVDREPDIRVFIEEVYKIETTRQGQYGLALRREPENPADRTAIAVDCWVYNPGKLYHLGYLWREDAAAFAKKFRSDMPIAVKLCRVTDPGPGKLWIGFQILIPSKLEPGWIRTRQKKSRS